MRAKERVAAMTDLEYTATLIGVFLLVALLLRAAHKRQDRAGRGDPGEQEEAMNH
jgi:hypothetical protein